MEARYKVVVDVGDGHIVVTNAERVRVLRQTSDGPNVVEFRSEEQARGGEADSLDVEEWVR